MNELAGLSWPTLGATPTDLETESHQCPTTATP